MLKRYNALNATVKKRQTFEFEMNKYSKFAFFEIEFAIKLL